MTAAEAKIVADETAPEVGALDLTVVIPGAAGHARLAEVLRDLRRELDALGITYEVLIAARAAPPPLAEVARENGARLVPQAVGGYGPAILAGVAAARGEYLLTLDADGSHPPGVARELWLHRDAAEVVIASRYVMGGSARVPPARHLASRLANALFRRGLRLQIHDLTSRFRLYRTAVLREQRESARSFDAVQRLVVQAVADGWRVAEIPFRHVRTPDPATDAGFWRFGLANLRTFWSLWKLRNSIASGDYDARAYDSLIPLQRFWQRRRYRIIGSMVAGQGPVLDVGCGSSQIIGALPAGSVGLDISRRKLRYSRRYGVPLVLGSGFRLPFRDGAFPCVLCSEVIEHVPKASPILDEICRVLAPGGRLVLGTPDYARWEWVTLEWLYGRLAPGGYADEHIAHYDREELRRLMGARGLAEEATAYVLHAELIMAFRKSAPHARQ